MDLMKAIALYRKLNPRSRAIAHTTWDGSGSTVRRATCIYCRRVVATSAAKYPETATSKQRRIVHGEACARAFLIEQARLDYEAMKTELDCG